MATRDASPATKPLRVLFLCTRNAARSQIAEAVLSRKVARLMPGRFEVASAGTYPADEVHPDAVEALRVFGIDWSGKIPKAVHDVQDQRWDLIITVCDRAKETCPVVPGQPAFAHWGMDDPAEVEGDAARARAFKDTLMYLSRRIDLLLALPVESLERRALETLVQQIVDEVPVPRHVHEP